MLNNRSNQVTTDGALRMQRRGDLRRMEILQAAGRIFRQRGFAETGMREIAAAADLSPGNLYHYFRGKHEILFFCQQQALATMQEALDTAQQQVSARDRLQSVLTTHVQTILDDVAGTVAHLEIDALPGDLRAAVIDLRDRYEHGLRDLVQAVMEEEDLPRRDPRLVTRAMLGALNWSAQWYRPQGPATVRALARDLIDYLLGGLSAPLQGKPASPPNLRGNKRG